MCFFFIMPSYLPVFLTVSLSLAWYVRATLKHGLHVLSLSIHSFIKYLLGTIRCQTARCWRHNWHPCIWRGQSQTEETDMWISHCNTCNKLIQSSERARRKVKYVNINSVCSMENRNTITACNCINTLQESNCFFGSCYHMTDCI